MAKLIKSPNKDYTGEYGTIIFKNGVGLSDNEYRIKELKEKGYSIEDDFDIKTIKTMNEAELKLFQAYNSYIDALNECIQEVHGKYKLNSKKIGTVDADKEAATCELVRIARTYLLADDSSRFTPYLWITSGKIEHLIALKKRKA